MKKSLSLMTAMAMAVSVVMSTVPVKAMSDVQEEKNGYSGSYTGSSAQTERQVAQLLSKMTLDEKIGQMIQAERGSVTPDDVKQYALGSVLSGGGSYPDGKIENDTRDKWAQMYDGYQAAAMSSRLGIPLIYGADGVHGHNNVKGATIFPHNIGLAASRDVKIVEKIGDAAAQEIKSTGVNWTFAPTVASPQNIRWGRTYEGFGDDPNLAAAMGAAYIKGLQGDNISDLAHSDHVVATAKHFIGEGYTKDGANQGNVTDLTEQQILDRDLKIYESAVKSGVRTVMASFHSIQGLKMHANKHLLTDVLKGDLKFDGFVISDWNAIGQITRDQDGNPVSGLKQQLKVAINAGVDMAMQPDNWKECIGLIRELVNENQISMARIDDANTRILRVKFQADLFKNAKTPQQLAKTFGSEEHRDIAREAVSESLVLLKNDKVNGQPILSQMKDMNKIFVAGKSADDIGLQTGGWTITWQGSPGPITQGTTILQGIKEQAGEHKTVTYNKHGRGAAGHDVAVVVVGEKPYAETNGDASKLNLDQEDLLTLKNVRESNPNIPIVVVLVSGRPMIVTDQMNNWAGLVAAWLPGTEGRGIADVLFGKKDFTGKLPIKWPFYLEAYQQKDHFNDFVLFDRGYGLTKKQATPALPPKPALPETPSQAIPGKIETEAFTDQQGLQTEKCAEGTLDVGWADGGDWLEYNVDVAQDGLYDVDVRYAANLTGTTGFKIYDEAHQKLGTMSVQSTGGYQNWATTTVKQVPLHKGKQKLRLEYTDGALNLNWFSFNRTGDIPPVQPPSDTDTQKPEVIAARAVESWVSSERAPKNVEWYYHTMQQQGDQLLEKQTNLDITKPDTSNVTTINIDPAKQYQSIMGIGSSVDESTVFNLAKMSPATREDLLKKMVDKNAGIGMSMMRLTIGTPDFTAEKFYTYDDMPAGQTDVNLEHFSIQKDIDYKIVDTVKQMQHLNPDMKFFASPWSPPGWMKTSGSMNRGQVKDEYLPVLAKYYLKYLQAYKQLGIKIDAMTLQNEPLLEIDYPSTKIPWEQEAKLAKLLRQELDSNGLADVKLWMFDHNPNDTMAYPANILKDNVTTGAYDAVDGTAFHDYGGSLSEMTKLHDLYPQKNVYLTERAVWGTEGADRIAQYFRNWAKSYNSWVVMLDSDIATHQWVGTPDPTLLIQDSSLRDNYWMTPEYYLLGQFSKFVEPGSIRIDSNYGSAETVTNVAFLSPDKQSIITVVINRSYEPQTFKLVSEGKQIKGTVPAKSVVTYKWKR